MSNRSETADAESFSPQLLQTGNAGSHEDQLVEFVLHAGHEHEVVASQVGLNHRADVHNRRLAGSQRLGRYLSAAEKNRIDIESVLSKESLFFSDPDVALSEGQRRVAHGDLLDFLAARRACASNKKENHCNDSAKHFSPG